MEKRRLRVGRTSGHSSYLRDHERKVTLESIRKLIQPGTQKTKRVVSWKPEQRGKVSRREYSTGSNSAKTNIKTTGKMLVT